VSHDVEKFVLLYQFT